MLRKIAFAAVLPTLLVANPAIAVTAKEKMATCKIGADSQNLKGAKHAAFIKKCMAHGNYEPPARMGAKSGEKPVEPKKP
jgi:hypothetical protein